MDNTFIYALADPRTGRVRYIGKSNNPVTRLKRHISSTRVKRNTTHRVNWIRQLLQLGRKPSLLILEQVSLSVWPLAERKWIALYKSQGEPLINHTSGGDGYVGGRLDQETRAKMSVAAKRRYEDPAEREKTRQSQLGRVITESHRKNISKACKGRVPCNKGVPMSVEQRCLISKALKGHIPWNKGKKIGSLSNTHRQKISKALKLAYAEGRRQCSTGRKRAL